MLSRATWGESGLISTDWGNKFDDWGSIVTGQKNRFETFPCLQYASLWRGSIIRFLANRFSVLLSFSPNFWQISRTRFRRDSNRDSSFVIQSSAASTSLKKKFEMSFEKLIQGFHLSSFTILSLIWAQAFHSQILAFSNLSLLWAFWK